jgi:hypothetical protein
MSGTLNSLCISRRTVSSYSTADFCPAQVPAAAERPAAIEELLEPAPAEPSAAQVTSMPAYA